MSFLQAFFCKTRKFEIPNFHGIQNMDKSLLFPKNSNMAQIHLSSYSYAKWQFLSAFLLFLAIITGTAKYKCHLKHKLSKLLLRSSLSSKFEASLINRAKMAGFLIFSHISPKSIFFRLYFINPLLLSIYFSKYLQYVLNTITQCQN